MKIPITLETPEVIALVLGLVLTAILYPVALSLFVSPALASRWMLAIMVIFGVLLPVFVIIIGLITKFSKEGAHS